jgi:alpha-D-xyloside xylohydrolase
MTLRTPTHAHLRFEAGIDTTLGDAAPLPELSCQLTFPAPNAVRVQVGRVLPGPARTAAAEVSLDRDDSSGLLARTEAMAVEVDKHPLSLRLLGIEGERVVEIAVQRRPPLGEFELRVSASPGARVYGCGEKFNGVDQSGGVVNNWSIDLITSKYADSYAPIPWYMSTDGYGLLLNNDSASIFDFRTEGRDGYEIRTRAFYVSGLATWLDVPEPILDFTLFHGPDLHRTHESFVRLTGQPHLMPEWAFEPLMGPAWPREFTAEVIEEYVERLHTLDLPHRTLYFDGFWERAAGDFAFKHFTDPKRLVDRIHDAGYRVVLWTAPWLTLPSAAADEAREHGYILTQAADRAQPYIGRPVLGGYYVDFTNPDAVEWYKARVRPMLEWGVDGFFADFGEADDIRNAAFSNGEIGAGFGEQYTVLYHQALHEACRDVRGDDFYLISRSGWTGIQRWAGLCSGDQGTSYDYLPVILNGLQSAGMSGMPFVSHCLGGYAGDHAKGPYLRWIQMGVFGPLFSIWNHGGVRTEPWAFDDQEVIDVYRRYAHLRAELLPHIYSLAKRAAETGLPMVQALGFAFEDDEEAGRWEDQYLFGDEFLVAPIYSDTDERDVYFPAGTHWYDFWTREARAGGTVAAVRAPLEILPVFVRAGSLIASRPVGEPARHDALVLTHWPGGDGTLRIHQRGVTAEAHATRAEGVTTISCEPLPSETLWIRALSTAAPEAVLLDGREVPAGDATWWHDAADGALWIALRGSDPEVAAIHWPAD